jgi:putative flippase GtrA
MISAIRRAWEKEQLRFLAIGGINTGVGYGLFVVIQLSIGKTVTYMGALVLSHVLASILAYALYRKIVFKVTGNLWLDFLRFQLVYAGSFGANLILLPTLVSGLGWNPFIGQACSVVLIAISSYVGHKWFTFRRTPEKLSSLEETEKNLPRLP